MIFILHFRGKSKIIADQYNKKHLLKPALFGKLTFLRNFVKKISLFCCARKKKSSNLLFIREIQIQLQAFFTVS